MCIWLYLILVHLICFPFTSQKFCLFIYYCVCAISLSIDSFWNSFDYLKVLLPQQCYEYNSLCIFL